MRHLHQCFRNKPRWLISFYLITCGVIFFPQAVFSLTLQQAEKVALHADPTVQNYQAVSKAFSEQSIADDTLPDPKLRLGMFNVPLDTFSTTQEATTQLRVGLQQAFPKGDSLKIKQQESRWLSQASLARADDQDLKITRDVRDTFLNMYYEIAAVKIINDSRVLFKDLVTITQAHYAIGRVNQQDVLRAELELSRLDDRIAQAKGKENEYRAVLAQWIHEMAYQPVSKKFPKLPKLPDVSDINKILTSHPSVEREEYKLKAANSLVNLAKQDYKPGFDAFVEYRKRFGDNPNGSSRPDMMAAMVTLDIPLFTKNRQDKEVAASVKKSDAAQYRLDDKLRDMKRLLERSLAAYNRLNNRYKIYQNDLLQSAKSNSNASLNAYQSGVTEFTTLMRARITELDVQLADMRVRVDRARAKASLLYITGVSK